MPTPQRDFNGRSIQEGLYLDSFGKLVHIKLDQETWVFSDHPGLGYTTLGNYSSQLLGRLSDPRQAATLLELLARVGRTPQSEEASTEVQIRPQLAEDKGLATCTKPLPESPEEIDHGPFGPNTHKRGGPNSESPYKRY